MKCVKCKYCKIVPDPDPTDWFCDDDEAIICTNSSCKTTYNSYQQKYYADRGWNTLGTIITSGERPYNIPKVDAPKYCPLYGNTN